MLNDLKTFYKYYILYKKGKREMEKAKEFVEKHAKEIVIAAGFITVYRIGFRRGFKTGMKFEHALLSLSTNGGK